MRLTALLIAAAVSAVAAAPATAAPPTATTAPATSVGAAAAELNGAVDPNQEPTTYFFEYGTTTAYGARTPDAGPLNGNAAKSVSATVTGLAAGTTYHFRLVARNASGTATGSDLTFTTPAASTPAVTIDAAPATVTFGRSTRIAGRVTGSGAGVKVQLDASPFPYTDPFKPAANGTTVDGGAYAFTVAPTLNTRYRVEAKAAPDATSAVVTVNVRPRVGLRLSDRTPRRGQRVRFAGSVLPAHDGSRVRLQRRTRTGWKTIATPLLRAATPVNGVARSKYAKRLRVRSSRTFRTVFVPTDGDHVRGKSPKRRARVH
jgi:hypothetical protein